METLRYPLLSWQFSSGLICALVVGNSYQVAGDNARKLRSILNSQIARDLEKNWHDSRPVIHEAKLKIVSVKTRPEYRQEEGIYPIADSLEVEVVAVYGKNAHGAYECFLPLLDRRFFFYDAEQAIPLVEHFARNAFNTMTPEQLHRYILPTTVRLEVLSVRSRHRPSRPGRHTVAPHVPALSKVSEIFPHPKSVRKKATIFPDVAWECGEKISIVIEKIERQTNLLLVGSSGVGKSAILREAMRKIDNTQREKQHEKERTSLTFWYTSPQRLIAGAKYLGDWEQICEEVVEDLQSVHGVLWLADFVELLRIGGQGAEDSIAAFLMPYVQQGRLQIIGEVTPRELEAARNILPGFIKYFQQIYIEEMDETKVLRIFDHFREYAQRNMGIELIEKAIENSYRLLKRYIKYESFPGKAIVFLSRCLNEAYLQQATTITTKDILRAFIAKTGMAELFLRDELPLDEAAMKDYFHQQIIGQDPAIEEVCKIVKIFKSGLANPNKPIATMVFTGPTGVGKTATAKALAKYFFGQGQKFDPLIRLDMSEFRYPGQIYRLIGSPHNPGKLVQKIRQQPFSVLLLDEIEKADSSVFDALLTVLDEGTLADIYGRVTDFRNTILIMTSNLGVGSGESIGFATVANSDYTHAVQSFFRPEFYNRIDMLVSFAPLSKEVIRKITTKELGEVNQREGLSRQNIQLHFGQNIIELLIKEGFHPLYGARPLQRAIERLVVAPLARYLLQNENLRNCRLEIDASGKKLEIRK